MTYQKVQTWILVYKVSNRRNNLFVEQEHFHHINYAFLTRTISFEHMS